MSGSLAAIQAGGNLRVYYNSMVSTDPSNDTATLMEFVSLGNSWQRSTLPANPAPLPGSSISAFVCYDCVAFNPQIFYLSDGGTNGNQINLLSLTSKGWTPVGLPNRPLAMGGSGISAFPLALANNARLYYLCNDGKLHQIAKKGSDDTWTLKESIWGGQAQDSSKVVAFGWNLPASPGGEPPDYSRVYLARADIQSLVEVRWVPPSTGAFWSQTFALEVVPVQLYPPQPKSFAAIPLDSSNIRVHYLGSKDNLVHELAWTGAQWSWMNATIAAGACAAAPGSAMVSIALPGNGYRVYFQDVEYCINELSFSSGVWSWRGLTKGMAGVAPQALSPLAAIAFNSVQPRVYYVDVNGDVNELAFLFGSWVNTVI